LVASAVADYSKDRVEERIPLHLSKREVCFGNGDGIGNLLEHFPLPKGQFFGIGERDE